VGSAPGTDRLEHGHQSRSVFGDGITHAGRLRVLLMTDQDPVANEFLKVADQHSLGHFGNAATQFAGAHGAAGESPQDGSLPAPVDHGQHSVDGTRRNLFFDTGMSGASIVALT